MGFLYRNRSSFPLLSRKRVVEEVFLSVLDYVDAIYRHAATSTLEQFDSVYHSALRFITGDSYNIRSYHWDVFLFLKPLVVNFLAISPPYYIGILVSIKPDACVRSGLCKMAVFFDAPSTWNALQ